MTMDSTFNPVVDRAEKPGLRKRIGAALIRAGYRLITNEPAAPAEPPRAEGKAGGGDRFASLASMIPGVVYQRIVTPEGDIRYTYISEGAREMFGVEPQAVLDDPEALFKTYSDDYKANFRQRLVQASAEMKTWDVEASIVGADGKIRYTHAIAKPEALPDGSVLWTGLILDATRIKLVEEELKAANRSVEAANKAKSLFLANMSHEIRTPMNGVLGMTDLLLKTRLNGRQSRLLNTLRHSAKTLLGIINDVLDISRIEAGRFELARERFDLLTNLEESIELCSGAAFAKGLETVLVVDGDIPGTVIGDAGRLRQILINLVGNAVKFTESGHAAVRVSTIEGDGSCDRTTRVRLVIEDTGIGISPGVKEALFAPFVQADSSISRKFGGTGLGLAITRHLVTLMGGTISLDSALGVGTTVTVELPFEEAERQRTRASPDVSRLARMRVLVADNRPIVREAIASRLAGLVELVEQASDELEAMSMLNIAAERGVPYTHVIVDRLRPGAENAVFCAALAGDTRFHATRIVRIVPMSAREDLLHPSQTQRGLALTKPVRSVDLYDALCASDCDGDASLEPAMAGPDQPGPSDGRLAPPQAGPLTGLRVLIAEDNPVNQELALEYVSGFGCAVELANNGAEAVEQFAPGKYDVILMDCQMPVLDGLSAVRQIRRIEQTSTGPRVPIIAVTANAYDNDRVAAREAGMDDYLIKPFSEDALFAVIEKWRHGRPADVAA